MDPKLDLGKLPSLLADLGSLAPPTPNGPATPTPGNGPVVQDKENVPSSGCPVGQGKGVSGQQSGAARSGRLLALLSSGSPGSGKKSDRYQNTPRLGLVMSGCHAVLQFVGCAENVSGSLLDTGWCVNNLYYTVRTTLENCMCAVEIDLQHKKT